MTSVDHLVRQFARSLRLLVPVMEDEGLPWRDEKTFDQFDEIAEALYNNIVLDCIEYNSGCRLRGEVRYGVAFEHYAARNLISFAPKADSSGARLALVALGTSSDPFDTAIGIAPNMIAPAPAKRTLFARSTASAPPVATSLRDVTGALVRLPIDEVWFRLSLHGSPPREIDTFDLKV